MPSLSEILHSATGITCHSAEVCPGDIFVAIRGRSHDGNKFAYQAARRGAAAIVSDVIDTQTCLGAPVVKVSDARKACAWLASEFYRHPSRELSLTGVTGTNGKTTIVAMLYHMYRTADLRAGMIGTVSVDFGDYSLPSKLTTPDSISLQRYLRQMRDQNVSHAAMEVSAQGMELNRVDNVSFKCGILTNVCPDHLDFHGDFASYVRAKQMFPRFLSGSPLIVNAADPECIAISRTYDGPVITAGINVPAHICARVLKSSHRGSVFQLTVARELESLSGLQDIPSLQLSAPGLHNVENAMLAAIAALVQGVSPYAIARGLASFGGVERRFKVCDHSGCTVIDDTALNPGSIDAVFETIRKFHFKRLVVVNAIRGCRGPAINAANAQALARWQNAFPFTMVITASHDHTALADQVTRQEQTAFLNELDRSNAKYLYTETLTEAIGVAKAVAQTGDLLLLIGAQGMDQGYSLLTAAQQHIIDYQAVLAH